MKKSEFVKDLAKYLEHMVLDNKFDRNGALAYAEEIVDFVEEAGMCPPPNDNQTDCTWDKEVE